MSKLEILKIEGASHQENLSGGRTCLPKFKFLANFNIGIHMILQLQIKKIQKCLISCGKKYFNQKSVEVQP